LVSANGGVSDSRDERFVGINKHPEFAALRTYVRHLHPVILANLAFNLERVIHGIGGRRVGVPGVEGDNSPPPPRNRAIRAKKTYVLIEHLPPAIEAIWQRGGEHLWTVQTHVNGNVVEHVVIAHPEASTDNGFASGQPPRPVVRRPGDAHVRSEVIE